MVNVLKLAKKLRGHEKAPYRNVSIKRDMTLLEREQMRKLVMLKDEKRAISESKGRLPTGSSEETE